MRSRFTRLPIATGEQIRITRVGEAALEVDFGDGCLLPLDGTSTRAKTFRGETMRAVCVCATTVSRSSGRSQA